MRKIIKRRKLIKELHSLSESVTRQSFHFKDPLFFTHWLIKNFKNHTHKIMNTIYCIVDSIMTTSKMTFILKEPQSQITHVEINQGCIITICAAIVLVVGIICLFAYLMANIKKKDSIKKLLKNDKEIHEVIADYILIKTQIDKKKISKYLQTKADNQLREIILDDIVENKNSSDKYE